MRESVDVSVRRKLSVDDKGAIERHTIEFPFGLPGFESLRKFMVVREKDSYPFHFLRSVEEPEVSMLVLDARLLKVQDRIRIPARDLRKVGIRDTNEMAVYIILKLDKKSRKFTANIKAPVVINTRENLGRQMILEDRELSVNYPLWPAGGVPAGTM